jgi:mRNA-degrading endonuclease RelE of RelBE toxin-antitoxin system
MAYRVMVHKLVERDIKRYRIPAEVVNDIITKLETIDDPRHDLAVKPVMCIQKRIWRVRTVTAPKWRGFYTIHDRQQLLALVAIRPRTNDTYNDRNMNQLLYEISHYRK